MSSKYLRIYCNDEKIRSTGVNKKQCERIMDDLILGGDRLYIKDILKNVMPYVFFHIRNESDGIFTIKAQLVRNRKNGKKEYDTLEARYYIIKKGVTYGIMHKDAMYYPIEIL